MALQPDNMGLTRAFLILQPTRSQTKGLFDSEKLRKRTFSAQKTLVQDLCQDANWEISQILKGMYESEDFYMQHVAQVRLNR